jgi:transcriptional regulator with XRE-family HTH domain
MMLLQDILKIRRLENGYTQEQIATLLFVSKQAISKWENGISMPSIDNLIALTDLYNVSLDELVQGSPFFKKPFLIGKKYNYRKGLATLLFWLLLTLLLTGFGYQPFWLFGFIFVLGIVLVLPIVFCDYWIIDQHSLEIMRFSDKPLQKLMQLFRNSPALVKLPYKEIKMIELIYRPKTKSSPFDFTPDDFFLKVSSNLGEFQLSLPSEAANFLPQFVAFLNRKQVLVIDKDHLLPLLIKQKSLYAHFHNL